MPVSPYVLKVSHLAFALAAGLIVPAQAEETDKAKLASCGTLIAVTSGWNGKDKAMYRKYVDRIEACLRLPLTEKQRQQLLTAKAHLAYKAASTTN